MCRIGRSNECTERGCQFERHFNAHCFGEKIKTLVFPTYSEWIDEKNNPTKHRKSRKVNDVRIVKIKKRPRAKDTPYRRRIYGYNNGMCHLCKKPVEYSEYTIDHVIPKSLGGKNTQDNLMPAHYECNVAKGNNMLYNP